MGTLQFPFKYKLPDSPPVSQPQKPKNYIAKKEKNSTFAFIAHSMFLPLGKTQDEITTNNAFLSDVFWPLTEILVPG